MYLPGRIPGFKSEDVKVLSSSETKIRYVEENAFVLPGRIPGFKSEDVKVLSSSETKMSVWRVYTATCEASGEQAVSYSKFVDLWQICA